MSRQYEIEFEPNRQLEINFKEQNMIDDPKIYSIENSRTPYKDFRIGKWVLRWNNKGTWKEEQFESDADAWAAYYDIVRELRQEYYQKQRGGK